MSGLDGAKRALLSGLFASVSDATLKTLDAALACGAASGGPLAEVHLLAQSALQDRRGRDLIFAPIAPLCRAQARLPLSTVPILWRALAGTDAEAVAAALATALDRDQADRADFRADALLNMAAERLVEDGGPLWTAARERLEGARPGAVEQAVAMLRIAPLIRSALPRMTQWVRAMNAEDASVLRLAYRDASEMDPPMGPLLVEILTAHLQQPWQVLRLLSAVMEHPSDAYLASSELGGFGGAVLDDLDARIAAVARFDAQRGAEGGAEAAASVMTAAMQAVEFEQWISVNRNSSWGRRLVRQRRELARAVELRLQEVEPAVAEALPWDQVRAAGRLRDVPRLDDPFDGEAGLRAQGLLAFLDGVRTCAAFGGFAVVRAKVIDSLDTRLERYSDALIAMIQAGEAEVEAARDRLDFAADCLSQVRDPAAAALVRRRAALAA